MSEPSGDERTSRDCGSRGAGLRCARARTNERIGHTESRMWMDVESESWTRSRIAPAARRPAETSLWRKRNPAGQPQPRAGGSPRHANTTTRVRFWCGLWGGAYIFFRGRRDASGEAQAVGLCCVLASLRLEPSLLSRSRARPRTRKVIKFTEPRRRDEDGGPHRTARVPRPSPRRSAAPARPACSDDDPTGPQTGPWSMRPPNADDDSRARTAGARAPSSWLVAQLRGQPIPKRTGYTRARPPPRDATAAVSGPGCCRGRRSMAAVVAALRWAAAASQGSREVAHRVAASCAAASAASAAFQDVAASQDVAACLAALVGSPCLEAGRGAAVASFARVQVRAEAAACVGAACSAVLLVRARPGRPFDSWPSTR